MMVKMCSILVNFISAMLVIIATSAGIITIQIGGLFVILILVGGLLSSVPVVGLFSFAFVLSVSLGLFILWAIMVVKLNSLIGNNN